MRVSKLKTKEVRNSIRKSQLKRFLPLLVFVLLIAIIGGSLSASHKKNQKKQADKTQAQIEKEVTQSKENFKKEASSIKPWYTYHSIAHALGGLDGKYYLNSIDAFYSNYKKGYRIFEMDLLLTTDNILVGRHTWGLDLSDPLSKKGDAVSYSEFKNTKIYGRYKPTSFLDMLNAMDKYPDFYLMTDTKKHDVATVQKQFSNLVQVAKKSGKEKYLDRIIVQIYNEKMFSTIKKIYPFKHFVYTTYQQPDAAFYKSVAFCKKNGIEGLTSPENDVNDYRLELLAKEGIYSFTHTVNSVYFAKEYMKLGVYGVYSDFLTPNEIDNSYLDVYCPNFASRYMKTILPGLN